MTMVNKVNENKFNDIDLLTGLKNRNALEQRLKEIEENNSFDSAGLGVVAANINGMKRYNDIRGLTMGDIQIRKTAVLIQEALSGFGEYFRVGGDEFCVIILGGREHFDRLMYDFDHLKISLEQSGSITFSEGHCYTDSGRDVRFAMETAYRKMREDKKKYYLRNNKDIL